MRNLKTLLLAALLLNPGVARAQLIVDPEPFYISGSGVATGPILFPNGTAPLPSIAFILDPTSGIYRATGEINTSVSGARVLSVRATGVFITSDSAPLSLGTSSDVILTRSADGKLKLTGSANASPMIQFAGTTSSFPAIKRNSTGIDVKLADDSAYAPFTAASYFFPSSSVIFESSNGVLRLSDAAQTSFGRLQFGGTSASFPALKRSTTYIQVKLADDSAFGNIEASLHKAADGTFSAPSYTFTSGATTGIFTNGSGSVGITGAGTWTGSFQTNGFFIPQDNIPIVLGASFDTYVHRDAAGVWAFRNGTTAEGLRLYGTYTDAANYIRLNMNYDGTSFNITQQQAGTGTSKQITFGINNGAQWALLTTGAFVAGTDNTSDMGANGANSARTVYASTSFKTNSNAFYSVVNKAIINTAPTISSGFGTSPSIVSNNGTAAFTINVGTGGVATTGVIGFPAAATGWRVSCDDVTTQSATVFLTKQTATSTTTASIGLFDAAGVAAAWVASNILVCHAMAY